MSDAREKARGQTSRSRTQRSQRTVSRGAQRGVSGKTTHVSSSSQSNNQTGQNSSGSQQNKKSGNERQADQLAKLQNQGQGNSTQARLIKNQLARSDAKEDRWNAQANRPMSFDEKMDAAYGGQLPGYMQDNINSQIQNYQDNPPKLEPKEITLADGTKMMTYGSFEPGQFSQNQYKDVLKYGIKPTDPSTSYMDFGFGSVFGTSSGSTASSPAVQQSLEAMMDDLYEQGYTQEAASQIAMDKMYPGYLNYAQGKGDIPANFMDMNVGLPLPGHQMTMNTWKPPKKDGSYGGGPGGWGDSWGAGGGGGGGGSGYGVSGFGQDQMPQGYQRGQVGPGSLQEQVNQMYLGMSGAGMQKKRGGIVSLLGL
tara:strand:- start:861 stop:1961 length:1101 start_codon:yes stop_codon:yes gene_type:complete